MKTILSFLALSVLATGCVQGTLSDDLTVNKDLQFALPTPSNFVLPACSNSTVFNTEQSTSIDISDPLTQLKKQGTLSVSFTENSISGDLSSFKHARVFIVSGGQLLQTPQLLTETDFVSTNGKVNLPILLSNDVLVNMLASGKVNLTVDLSTCVPANPVDVHYVLSADVSLSVNKGL